MSYPGYSFIFNYINYRKLRLLWNDRNGKSTRCNQMTSLETLKQIQLINLAMVKPGLH